MVSLTTAQVIFAAQSRILEYADIVADSTSFKRVKDYIKKGEALIRYIRVLQTDSTLTQDEQTAICQHMINIGNLYDFPASPTITSNEIFNFAATAEVGPQGPQGIPGQDGGGTDYNQFSLTGNTNVDSFAVTDADAAEWTYKVKDGANLRSGRITACWLSDGSQIKSFHVSTMDIGDTSPVDFSVIYSAGTISLRALITSGTWNINGTRYFIPNNGAGVIVQSTALENGKILIGNSTNQAAAQAVSGDITINNVGTTSISPGVINNGDISGTAAIALSKLAALTADRALISNASGVIIASGISTTKLGYLTDVTSNIQAQLDSKVGSITGAISTVVSSNLSANKVVISDAAGKIAASSVSDVALSYIGTLSSNAQTQLDGKQSTITGGASSITAANLTANRALLSDASGKVAVSAVTNVELGYVSGATSNIQAQINAISTTSGTYTPTLTNGANVASSVSYRASYSRVGNVVTVGGRVEIDPTAAGADTRLKISLPIASNLADNLDCSGMAIDTFNPANAEIFADAVNNTAELQYFPANTSASVFQFVLIYNVI